MLIRTLLTSLIVGARGGFPSRRSHISNEMWSCEMASGGNGTV